MPSVDSIEYPRTDFPADLECHPLLVVDFERIAAGDEKEIDTLYTACTQLGFFYLKNFGFEDVIEPMFEMGKATFDLSKEELMPFEQGDTGMSAGYVCSSSFLLFPNPETLSPFPGALSDLLSSFLQIQVCRKHERRCEGALPPRLSLLPSVCLHQREARRDLLTNKEETAF
jgi:hypothetical protein